MAKCIIVGAGEFCKDFLTIEEMDYVIAADGGYEYLRELGITPHMWIGDMDSTKISTDGLDENITEIIRLPREKDDTDTLAAIRIGIEKGYTEFVLHGMLGGRVDHTFANISCLQFLKKHGCKGILYGRDTMLLLLKDEKISFSDSLWGMVSAFALGDSAQGVTEQGLLYEIENATLTPDFPIGVSNELIGKESMISVEKGMLLVSVIPDREKMLKQFNDRVFRIDNI